MSRTYEQNTTKNKGSPWDRRTFSKGFIFNGYVGGSYNDNVNAGAFNLNLNNDVDNANYNNGVRLSFLKSFHLININPCLCAKINVRGLTSREIENQL